MTEDKTPTENRPAVVGPVERQVRPVSVAHGSDEHLTFLGAPQHLNLLTGQDRDDMLAFGRACMDAERRRTADENRALRRLLAVRVAGALLYADDGELQDNTQNPHIDFRRDTPSEIQRKLQERGLANYRRSLEDEARGLGA